MSDELVPHFERAPGLLVAPGVAVPDDAKIGPWVTLHAGVTLGAGVSLQQGAIVGRPQWIDDRARVPRRAPGAETLLGDGSRVGSYALITAGATLEPDVYLGDYAAMRENARLERRALVGRHSVLGVESRVGAGARLHGYAVLAPRVVLEDDVVAGPGVKFMGDRTLGRRHGLEARAVLARRRSRIGAGAVVFAPVEIGEEAVVAAGAVVREDVAPRTVVAGTPARLLRAVRDDELLEEWT